ncbi:MAG: NfeD-like protein [Ruminococcaceae bacterium]|nr:NfeD-like protein [Oscillospiraceae bacterium]
MLTWWNSLSLVAQIFACIAVPATLVLIVQTILMLIGIGAETADGDGFSLGEDIADADTDTDGVFSHDVPDGDIDPSGLEALRLFTVRGIISFLVVFGWVGYGMESAGVKLWITIPVALVCGFAMMSMIALLMRSVMKLRNDGNLDNRNAVGVSGKVYLTVPANRKGEGKVNVMLQGSFVERDAVTDENEDIPTGREVVVTGLSGQTALVVRSK